MANTFAEKITKYIPLLDEIYQRESLTAFLEMNPLTVMFDGTKTVKLPKIVLSGAGDYSRSTGYAAGDIAITWGSYDLSYDRGRKFGVDIIDDDELGGIAFMKAAAEYVRTKEIPETDAVRFAEMYVAAAAGGTVVTADLTANTAIPAFDAAELTLGDNEVGEANRIMWCSYTYYKLLKEDTAVARRIDAGDLAVNGINRKVNLLDGETPIIRVPKGRFFDVITLYDGTSTGQEAGHYIGTAATSRYLNFIYADKSALNAVTKRRVSKVIGWERNQTSDENLVFYRNHHDLIIPSNKQKGIYVHRQSTVFDA